MDKDIKAWIDEQVTHLTQESQLHKEAYFKRVGALEFIGLLTQAFPEDTPEVEPELEEGEIYNEEVKEIISSSSSSESQRS